MEEITLLESIKKRLEIIISLLLQERSENSDKLPLRSQIDLLNGFGLKPKEIAEILGKTTNYISKEISGLRKAKKTKKCKIKQKNKKQ